MRGNMFGFTDEEDYSAFQETIFMSYLWEWFTVIALSTWGLYYAVFVPLGCEDSVGEQL